MAHEPPAERVERGGHGVDVRRGRQQDHRRRFLGDLLADLVEQLAAKLRTGVLA
jgi:hypothetical protein